MAGVGPKAGELPTGSRLGEGSASPGRRSWRVNRRTVLFVTKCVFSCGLIFFILLRADLGASAAALLDVDLLMLGAAVTIMALGVWLRALKWQLLLKAHDVHVPLRSLHNTLYVSLFFNNFFLGTLGGDAVRVYRTVGPSRSLSIATAPVIMDRVTGFLSSLSILVMAVLVLFLWHDAMASSALLGLLAGTVVAAIGSMLLGLTLGPRLIALLPPSKFRQLGQNLLSALTVYGRRPVILGLSLLLSIVFQLFRAATLQFFVWATGSAITFMHMLFISQLVGLIVMIPISLNGLGLQEASYMLYLEQVGLTPANALLVALLSRAGLLLLSLIGAVLFVIGKRPAAAEATTRSEPVQ